MSLTMEPDSIDPNDEDWAYLDRASVWQAAHAGIEPAVAEARRRGLTGW